MDQLYPIIRRVRRSLIVADAVPVVTVPQAAVAPVPVLAPEAAPSPAEIAPAPIEPVVEPPAPTPEPQLTRARKTRNR